MKTIISFVAVLALIVTSSFTIRVQESLNNQSNQSCFSQFRAHRAGKAQVMLQWNVNVSDVAQFHIERSYDGSYFDPAGTVPSNGGRNYRYTDENIYPGYLHYRVIAQKTDGSTECSPTVVVRVVQH